MRFTIPFALLLPLPLGALAAEPKVEEFAPHASGVALAEVVAVEKFDARPSDGPAGVTFKLKLIRGSGEFPGSVSVITAHGGFGPPGVPAPKPSAPVKPDSFKKGDRVWFVFSSEHDFDRYNQGVIGFWPEKDKKAEALEAAVKADAYRWHPQYDPKTKLTYGRIVEKDRWRVRVEKDKKVLWEKELFGAKTVQAYDWNLRDNAGGDLEVTMPKCGKMLFAELAVRLEKGNEFGVEPGPYWVMTGLDPETGKRLASWVRLPQESHVAVVDRTYDPDTGKPKFEQRYDWPKTGGKAVGAKTEDWFRKIERTFDADGKVKKEEVFRYDDAVEGKWRKVN